MLLVVGQVTGLWLFNVTLCYLQLFKSPIPAVFATTLVSAFIHEYLLALVLKFASPMLLLEFAGLGSELVIDICSNGWGGVAWL